MRSEVVVVLATGREFFFDVGPAGALDSASARRWLDDQFIELDCEPLRATGKVLIADKVLAIALEAGEALLADAEWGRAYAQAVRGALGRPNVRVDLVLSLIHI